VDEHAGMPKRGMPVIARVRSIGSTTRRTTRSGAM
jgi:hypothetical protein